MRFNAGENKMMGNRPVGITQLLPTGAVTVGRCELESYEEQLSTYSAGSN